MARIIPILSAEDSRLTTTLTYFTGDPPWHGFDNSGSTYFHSTVAFAAGYITWLGSESLRATSIQFTAQSGFPERLPCDMRIDGTTDGETWEEIVTFSGVIDETEHAISSSNYYTGFRFYIPTWGPSSGGYCTFAECVFLGDTGATTVSCDVLRQLVKSVSVPCDTSRKLSGPVSIATDTLRQLITSVEIAADTRRELVASKSVLVDTLRKLITSVNYAFDTKRRLINPLSDIQSLTIGLKSQVLGDSFSLDSALGPALMTPFAGTLYGWPWQFVVRGKRVNPATKRYVWTGDYDISELLKRYIRFSTKLTSASAIMAAVANQIGKQLNISIDDHSINSLSDNSKVMDVISSLFSWTSGVPHRQVNVFLRGNTLYCLQRGKESSTYTPVKYNILSIDDFIVDTLMDESTTPKIIGDSRTDGYTPGDIYFSGTFSFGDATVTFENGLNTLTETIDDGVTTSIRSTYSSDNYILTETIETSDDSIYETKRHTYGTFGGETYKSSVMSDRYRSGKLREVVELNYYPLGFGFYGQKETVYRVGADSNQSKISERTSISEGRPGGPASPFALQRAATNNTGTPSVDVARNPVGTNHIPVTDTATLGRYAAGLEYLDGKTQYNATIEVFDDHICDFTEMISVMGQTWYIDANTIAITGEQPHAKQTIDLVRWA